jgi:hypothetical protein
MLHTSIRTVLAVAASLSLFPALPAQRPAATDLHWYLRQRMEAADAADRLPVYFVMADALGYDHWFPRVLGMPLAERRALVIRELREHAARTQAPLLDALRALEDSGEVTHVRSNWLGNFVSCRATPAAIRRAADRALAGVDQVRFAASWPIERVADGADAAAAVAADGAGVPADGVLNTRANLVWDLGFRGQGVRVMNVDEGINVLHGDLVSRVWTNPGEIAGNDLDDDGNGYVDDVHGFDFYDDDDSIDDGGGHGTQTAGTMVGDGSCSGTITGQAPQAQVMTGAIGPGGPQTGPYNASASEMAQWEGIQYAVAMGADVQTSSYSYKNSFTPPPDYGMHRRLGEATLAAGLIRTNSTSNNGSLAQTPTSIDRVPFNISAPGDLPPPYLDPNQTLVGHRGGVVGVGAHDVSNNSLMSYSPRGPFAWNLDDLLAVLPAFPLIRWAPNSNDYPWRGGTQQGLIKPDVTGPTNTRTTLGAGATCATGAQSGTSNATPRVAGAMMLWKSANPSLGPEDMAMIVHQTATPSGVLPGKENNWGAGRVDAFAGALLALCVHRVNGVPAWSVTHQTGTVMSSVADTVPNAPVFLIFGSERRANVVPGSGVLGVAGNLAVAFAGVSDASGVARLDVFVPPGAAGHTLYMQWFTDDLAGVTARLLSSNVIAVTFE